MQLHPLLPRCRPAAAAAHAAAFALLVLAGCGGTDGSPPTITSQPQAQTVQEGSAVTFAVAGESQQGELSFEWGLENGALISGATTASYHIETTSLADHGKRFVATLRNDAGSTSSVAALLSVTERSWGTPLLPVAGTDTLPNMAVAVDSLGTTHLAYTELLANNITRLNLAYKGPNLSFPGSSRGFGGFQVPAGTTHQQMRLVPGSGGAVMVLWREGIADELGNVLAAALLYDEGNGFATLGSFTDPGGNAMDADGAWVSADTFEVAYRRFDGTRWNIATRRFTLNATRDGGQWDAEASVEALDVNLGAPRIASDGAGNVLVAFSPTDTTPRAYVNARAAAATTWQAESITEASGFLDATPANVATLAMNAQGRGVLLMRSDQTRVFMRIFEFGAASPGWQAAASYVANQWDNLPGDVEPALVFHDGGPGFSIVSVHNNGRFISRWACGSSTCGAPQTFVDAGPTATVHDLRVARDAAGNFVAAYALMQPDESLRPRAVRFHQALDAWRADVAVGDEPVNNRLALAVAADGRATLLFGTEAPSLVPRSADFR